METPIEIFKKPRHFDSALRLDDIFPLKLRNTLSRISGGVVLVLLILILGPIFLAHTMPQVIDALGLHVLLPAGKNWTEVQLSEVLLFPNFLPYLDTRGISFSPLSSRENGLLYIAFGVWLCLRMLGWFRNSKYFLIESLLETGKVGIQSASTIPNWETNNIFFHTTDGDLTASFLHSSPGRWVLARLGITYETTVQFIRERGGYIDFNLFPKEVSQVVSLLGMVNLLLIKDEAFANFLFAHQVRPEDLSGATDWIERDLKRRRQSLRFWGRVNLGSMKGVGSDLSYGVAYELQKYSTDYSTLAISGGSNFRHIYGNEEIKQLTIVLNRSQEANAILVGEEGGGVMDVVLDFARDVMNGYSAPKLKEKHVIVFNTKIFLAGMKEKSQFETSLIRIMNGVVKAGNIILVLEDLPGFMQGAASLESDIMGILDPYLATDRVQLIATSDPARFHSMLSPNGALMRRFQAIHLKEPEVNTMVRILEETASGLEPRYGILFTYQSLLAILDSAERYIADGVMPDKAVDLLVEIASARRGKGKLLVDKNDVGEFIQAKTNIPVGQITDDERKRLGQLEALLQARVIGQTYALKVVADAMRRNRAGVRAPNRPIGSFLFLGPTGVGKTETAKALAQVFFGDENAMSRLDMSEYQAEDGISRLIGDTQGSVGALALLVKERPYGVLLLDEFEKTNPKVLDLFLQVLDEGIFHDALGKKVNARNLIIIATSNAGSQYIRQAVKEGIDLEGVKKTIIDQIIADGKLKPELINRFDGSIIFHPLSLDEYRQIATLMLEKLRKRMRERSIDLVVNDVLVEAALARGVDQDFGARPMARAIQEVVEQKVAEKIISGKILPGARMEFTREDFVDILPPIA